MRSLLVVIPALCLAINASDRATAQQPASSTGELVLQPAAPVVGEVIRARYRPASALAGEPVLRVRARVRTAESQPGAPLGARTLTLLERSPDGSFHGALELPADVVFATLAIEDTAGTAIDTHDGAFWEILVSEPDGKPGFEALLQRMNDFLGRDERELLHTAQRLTEFYPARVLGWNALHFADGLVHGEAAAYSRRATHLSKLREFDRALFTSARVDADELSALCDYAEQLEESETAARCRRRLATEFPHHASVLLKQLGMMVRELRGTPAVLLARYDSLWRQPYAHTERARLAGLAFSSARQAADSTGLVTWGTRWQELDPAAEISIAAALAAVPTTRKEGIRRLRLALSRLAADTMDTRELGWTRAEGGRQAASILGNRQAQLGNALVRHGQLAEAIPLLERAAEVDWVPARHRALGAARLAIGDSTAARAAFATAAADPDVSPATADSLRRSAGASDSDWTALVADARGRLLQHTLARAVTRAIPAAEVSRADGSRVQLQQLLGPDVTVVVFWSRYCHFSVEALPGIAAVSSRLAVEGVPLLAITEDEPADAQAFLKQAGHQLTVLFDPQRSAVRALNSWGTPQYYILDGQGRLRFASSLNWLMREVAALRSERNAGS